eukprot:TRINITY_DN37523_c0_g1_i1.p1 TRINITY_DN37523_c0_g1~~TRINITY_DN37523_c0_g1_i1.p1  ORF type:complete len:446 (+),score=146.56 TRINITY_DN37523_c0_g1_i1:130-1467(+)
MLRSLVGSEMCIRDRHQDVLNRAKEQEQKLENQLALEKASKVAKELADGLVLEEQTQLQVGGKKPGKCSKAGKKKKQAQRKRPEVFQDRIEAQQAEADKRAEQEKLAEMVERRAEEEREYERRLVEEQHRLAAREERQRIEEAARVEASKRMPAQALSVCPDDVGDPGAMGPGEWQCGACTFVNPSESSTKCAMCGQAKSEEQAWSLVGSSQRVLDAPPATQLEQALGQVVERGLGSLELCNQMAKCLCGIDPCRAAHLVETLVADHCEQGQDDGQVWARFMVLLQKDSELGGSHSVNQQPCPTDTMADPLQSPTTPKTPGKQLAAERAVMGLTNQVGQRNCFLNVVIQSLWHLQDFRIKFLQSCQEACVPVDQEGTSTSQAEQVLSALYSVFSAYKASLLNEESDGVVETSALRCLLYTSDAADEEDSVDLGGRRIIKKKKRNK